jgi:hypothetical protein
VPNCRDILLTNKKRRWPQQRLVSVVRTTLLQMFWTHLQYIFLLLECDVVRPWRSNHITLRHISEDISVTLMRNRNFTFVFKWVSVRHKGNLVYEKPSWKNVPYWKESRFGAILNYQVAPDVNLEKACNHGLQANIRFQPFTFLALRYQKGCNAFSFHAILFTWYVLINLWVDALQYVVGLQW